MKERKKQSATKKAAGGQEFATGILILLAANF
jgi:hypothetical protein